MDEKFSIALAPRQILFAAVLVCLALHLPTFYSGHSEGDEVVFRKLSENMTWTLGHYTVMDVPALNKLLNRLYRAPLYPHPPLYPFLLKVCASLGGAIELALALGLLLKLAAVFYVNALLRFLQGSGLLAAIGAFFFSLCPILSFTSTRLLADTAFSVFLLIAVTHLLMAQAKGGRAHWFLSALGFILFFNAKYQSIAFLPLPILLLARERRSLDPRIAVPFLLSVLVLGGQHFLRMGAVYGSPFLGDLLHEDYPANHFVATIGQRSRLQICVYLLALYPFFLALLSPDYWRNLRGGCAKGDRAAVPGMVAIYAFFVSIVFMHTQERYWEPFVLFAILSVFLTLEHAGERTRSIASFLLLLTFVDAGWTSFLDCVVYRGDLLAYVRPCLSMLSPGLQRFYFHFGD